MAFLAHLLLALFLHARAHPVWRNCQHSGTGDAQKPLRAVGGNTTLQGCKALCESDVACQGIHYRVEDNACALATFVPASAGTGVKCLQLTNRRRTGPGVFVMLPLDTVGADAQLKDEAGLARMLDVMGSTGVDGFMTDVWWGVTEPRPREYRFDGYKRLVALAKARGLQIQAITSFHQCGGNVGDDCDIPLPAFVREAEGVWYRDQDGDETHEYISLFADNVKVAGRSPLEMYSDWFRAFRAAFREELGTVIAEVEVGMGPAGELRYPSYRMDKWSFCGIGAFQAHDRHALASLRTAARAAGHALEWGQPPNASLAGSYNSEPSQTAFFSNGYRTGKGKFFLDWYSKALKSHAVELLARAKAVFGDDVPVAGKVAGIHWWYGDSSHAAEVTSGYYNTNFRNAYAELADVFKRFNASLDFTCMEMRNEEQPQRCLSRPEELVHQVLLAGKEKSVPVSGENALQRFDDRAYDQVLSHRKRLQAFTYLRLGPQLLEPGNLDRFRGFVERMHGEGGGRRLQVGQVPEVFV